MSAIAGIYYRDGRSVDRAVLQRMTNTMTHRGPDGSAVVTLGQVGFGHQMLWTTPESLNETLPCAAEDGDSLITADARIDNREELLPLLGLTHSPPEQISDSQVILAAYQRWGEDCLDHLLGDFAFAIWDAAVQKLFCARDHFGIKPFYYHQSGDLFAFATEIKALFSLTEVPQGINELHLAEYLLADFLDTTSTSYEEVLRLSPAHCITVTDQSVALRHYWRLDLMRETSLASDDEYAKQFLSIFTEAVRCRLRSALPVGSLLSGGLDSSSITCVARQLLREQNNLPLDTFSAVFDETPECDERAYIETTVAQGGLCPHYINVDGLGCFEGADHVMHVMDEPHYGPSLFSSLPVYRCARRSGIRVLLNGHDGDGTVSHGFGYMGDLARTGRWIRLWQEARGVARGYDFSAASLFWNQIMAYMILPKLVPQRGFQLGRGVCLAALRQLKRKAASEMEQNWSDILQNDLATFFWEREAVVSDSTPVTEREEHYQGITQTVQPLGLEILDKAAAMHTLEFRYPFWDKRLVEFCLSLPGSQKLKNGWGRGVMRQSMEGILPPEIQWRRDKTNFVPYLKKAFLVYEKTRTEQAMFADTQLPERYVKMKEVQCYYRKAVSDISACRGDKIFALWRFVSLSHWLHFRSETG